MIPTRLELVSRILEIVRQIRPTADQIPVNSPEGKEPKPVEKLP